MSVTQYEIPCSYDLLKLKDTVFFLSKNSLKTINIDNGEAYATFVNQSPYPPSPNRLKGFNVKLTETESLDERYKFTKQLTMSIHGHLTDSRFLMDDDYYIVVQTEDGTYYLVNVDFPSKMSFVYNLSEGQDQTDFTFVSNSNHPTLKLNWNPSTWNTCQTYQVYGIDSLKLLEKDYTTIDVEQGVINLFDGHEFKDVEYFKNTISLQENYDGKIATTTITFEIPFNNYKPSWQYNLLEFTQNLYTAHITPKNSTSGIFCGYEHGLQPSYELNGNTSNGESTSIKITLTEASEWGIFKLDTWSYYRDSSKRWIGVDSEHICVEFGIGAYLLMQEVDGNGTPTGRYKCLEGYQNRYSNYNIVETYDEAPRFASSDCARSMARRVNSDTYYTCIDGDKYSIKFTEISYDNKKSWIRNGEYELGDMVESGSSWCEIEPQYKWEISNKWGCIPQFERWIPSGTTCINGDKYQNNYMEVSDDGVEWRETSPLVWSASTLIERDSEDCKIYRWSPTHETICVEDTTTRIISPEYIGVIKDTQSGMLDLHYVLKENTKIKIKFTQLGGEPIGELNPPSTDDDYGIFYNSSSTYHYGNDSIFMNIGIVDKGEVELGNYYVQGVCYPSIGTDYRIPIERSGATKVGVATSHTRNLYAFVNGRTNIYYLQIYEGDTLVRDFVPWTDVNRDNYGFFDKVSKTVFLPTYPLTGSSNIKFITIT